MENSLCGARDTHISVQSADGELRTGRHGIIDIVIMYSVHYLIDPPPNAADAVCISQSQPLPLAGNAILYI